MEKQNNDPTKSQDIAKMSELLRSQTNAPGQEDKSKSNGEAVHEPYKGTPFVMRKYADSGWFATIGKHRVTEEEPTKEALISILDGKDWNLLLAVITAACEEILMYREEMKNIPQG